MRTGFYGHLTYAGRAPARPVFWPRVTLAGLIVDMFVSQHCIAPEALFVISNIIIIKRSMTANTTMIMVVFAVMSAHAGNQQNRRTRSTRRMPNPALLEATRDWTLTHFVVLNRGLIYEKILRQTYDNERT